MSVCVSVQMITFELLKPGTSFLAYTYIFMMSRSGLSTKVIGSRSKSNEQNFIIHIFQLRASILLKLT